MNRLIGDIGATGSSWAYLDKIDHAFYFEAPGYNPISQGDHELRKMIATIKEHVPTVEDWHIWYYGAGAGNKRFSDEIVAAFRKSLSVDSIEVGSDLLAAARALCGDEPGTACILGTGSNVGTYDGSKITRQAASLGYPLGDEGSGTDLGKRLAKSFYYDQMPTAVREVCKTSFPSDRYEFLANLRDSKAPNRYLASFTKLIFQLKDNPWINNLIMEAFEDFVRTHLGFHKKSGKIKFAGSIAFYFCDELERSLTKYDLELGEVMKDPLESLVNYHKTDNKL